MRIKAVLSDFDETLVDLEGNYDKRIPALIKKLTSKNIHFSLATGRSSYGPAGKIINELKISDYHIFHGGSLILNTQDNKIHWYQPISDYSIDKIVHYFKKRRLIFSLELKDRVYLSKIIETPAYSREVNIKKLNMNKIPSGVLKILLIAIANKLSEKQIDILIKKIEEACKDVKVIKFRRYEYFGFDVTSEKASKHTAVLEYAKILKLNHEEMIGIGDGYNDYPLFTACGYKIAMGNAPKELLEIADKVVSTVENGGMIEALEHIISML